jgi:hypothetical protein
MRTRHVQALVGITVLGALLRFVTLGHQSFWGDEGVTVALVRMGFGDMLDTIPKSESTPPLYYALAWLWTRALGSSEEYGLRSLSALAGTAAVPAVYAAAATLTTRRIGLVAAALAAGSPLLVWYSQESRAYALLTLTCAVALWQFARVLDGRPRAVAWWAVAAGLAIATHYFAAWVVVPQALWLMVRAPAPSRRPVAIACAALALAGAALLPLALEQRSTGNTAYIADIGFGQRAKEVPKKFLVGEQASPGDYGTVIERLKWPALLLALVAAGLAIARTEGRERSGAAVAAGLAGIGLAMPLLLKVMGLDYVAAYNLQELWVPAAIAAAAGLGARRAGWLGIGAAAALCAMGVGVVLKVATDSDLQRYDYRGVARYVRDARAPTAIVVTPDNSLLPIGAYARGVDYLPPGARVNFVYIIGMHSQDESTRARAFDPAYRPTVPGFTLAGRIDNKRFTLIALRSARPVPVDLRELGGDRLGSGDAALLLKR